MADRVTRFPADYIPSREPEPMRAPAASLCTFIHAYITLSSPFSRCCLVRAALPLHAFFLHYTWYDMDVICRVFLFCLMAGFPSVLFCFMLL